MVGIYIKKICENGDARKMEEVEDEVGTRGSKLLGQERVVFVCKHAAEHMTLFECCLGERLEGPGSSPLYLATCGPGDWSLKPHSG